MEYKMNIQGISINIHAMKQSETQTQWGAAEGGACVSDHFIP